MTAPALTTRADIATLLRRLRAREALRAAAPCAIDMSSPYAAPVLALALAGVR